MNKYDIDFSKIEKMYDNSRIPVKGNEEKMIRIAFDFFRVDGDDACGLWQVQADDDGTEYLVRTFTDADDKKVIESKWSVLPDKKCANLTVSYDNIPIKRLPTAEFGAKTAEDVYILQKSLRKKLALDENFSYQFISDLPETKREILKKNGAFRELSAEEQWKIAFDKLSKEKCLCDCGMNKEYCTCSEKYYEDVVSWEEKLKDYE